jgi:AAA+ ATPase superfamily predicted ATPase
MALDLQARYVEEDWEALFAFLAQRVDVVVIDEFPNLIAEDKAVLSTLQAVVDQVLSGTNVKLMLVGSSVMTSRVLSYKSPLYGRKTLAMRVKPVPFLEYRRFFPERPAEELVEIHGFAGGVPHYMLKIGKPFWQFLDAELREKPSYWTRGTSSCGTSSKMSLPTSSCWRRWRLGAAPSAR